jgi:transcriptional regulator with XRE-family HTH domain
MQINLEKIKALRKAKKLSQKEFAQKIGYKSSTGYHYIESGKRNIKAETLAKIAKILEVPIEDLYNSKRSTSDAVER